MRHFIVSVMFILACAEWVEAQSSVCDRVLVQQSLKSVSDRTARLAWLRLVNESNHKEAQQSARAWGEGWYGPIGGSSDLTWGQSQAEQQKRLSLEKFNYGIDESRAVLRSYLSDAQVTAWSDCMRRDAQLVRAILYNDSEKGATAEIRYDGIPKSVIPFTVEVEGGTFKGKKVKHVQSIPDHGKWIVRVNRDSPKSVIHLIVNGGGMADSAYSFGKIEEVTRPVCVQPALLSFKAPVTASVAAGAAAVTDGNKSPGNWNAGAGPHQWVEIDLGSPSTVTHVTLIPEQTDAIQHVKNTIFGVAPDGRRTVIAEQDGITVSGGEYTKPIGHTLGGGIQKVRIETIRTNSWVSWREIEVYGCR